MKVYIAGPMRNCPEHNRPAFDRVATHLRLMGVDVVNPFEMCTEEEINATDVTPELCRRFCERDIAAILECDGIFMLRGWEQSIGARAEHAVAVWCKLDISYQSTL